MQRIDERRATVFDNDLATECGTVSDRLNNLLTGIQLRAGLLLESAGDSQIVAGLEQIVHVAKEAAALSARLRELSDINGSV